MLIQNQTFKIWAQYLVAIIALGFAAALVAREPAALLDSFARLTKIDWVIVLALSLANYLLRFARWHIYIRKLRPDANIPFPIHALYYIAGFAFTLTPGKLGELYRAVYLKRHHVDAGQTFSALVVERMLDVASLCALAGGVFIILPQYGWFLAITIGLISLVMVVASFLSRRTKEISMDGRWGRISNKVYATIKRAGLLLNRKDIFLGLLIGIPAWATEAYGLYWILQAMGQPISLLEAASVYSIAILAGALSFMPGGLGGTEIVMVAGLHFLGVNLGTAGAASLICRLATLWFAIALGILSIISLNLLGARIDIAESIGAIK
jgi:uncharacterized protein (TIRG00374 family)